MKRLSFVGIWFGSPSHSMKRFSNRWTVWVNGILSLSPGVVIGRPTGLPNCVTTTCSVSLTV